ncbi:MAG: Crp/Fnr family transcriptional regulator [Prevotellaceae bacterium]|jgi:CRP-like cAMP-binding protein|nr:Crp/Fnr family transcriptional regulator [Prevotellaceae bacterium]
MTTGDKNIEGLFALLPYFTPQEKDLVWQNTTSKVYRKGEFVFQEGDSPVALKYLTSGKVKVFKQGVGGRAQILRLVSSWGLLGFRGLLANEPHFTTAQAMEPSLVCHVDRTCMQSIINSNSKLTAAMVNFMAGTLGFSYWRTVSLTQKHIRGRVADALLILSNIYGFEEDGTTMRACFSREDIASLSNMTTANAIRTLSAFQDEQIVKLERRRIQILDPQKVHRISELG